MSLVPIIYTSLLLFFGLLMLVIIISYLTFRTKAKINPVIAEEIKKQQKKVIVIKQKQYTAPPSLIPIQKNYNTGRSIALDTTAIQPNYYQAPNNENNARNNRYTRQVEEMREQQRRYGSTSTNSRKRNSATRIEIVNNTKKFQTGMFDTQVEKRFENYSRNKSDYKEYDMLNFYSDYPEVSLNTLTAAHRRAV